MIKISDEQAAKLGIKSFEELEEKLSAIDSAKAESKTIVGRIDAIATRLDKLDASVSDIPRIDKDALVKDVLTQASASAETISAKAISSAVARAGQQGLAPNKPDSEGTGTKSKPAPDDFKAQWDADANLRDEFLGSFRTYEAYAEAEKAGRIDIRNRR